MKRFRMLTPLALLLAFALALAGCTAGAGQTPSAAEIIEKMRETMKSTQTAQGVVDLSVSINKEGIRNLIESLAGQGAAERMAGKDPIAGLPDTASATLKTWRQAPDKVRVEVDKTTLPGASGAILVYDGQKVYAYDAARNTLYTGTLDKMLDKMPDELKAILQSGDMEKELDKLLDAADIKVAGSEKVAGLDAYKLEITPKPDAADRLGLPEAVKMQAGVLIKDVRATLWVDQARWIPLKVEVEHPNIGKLTSATTQIELNKPIDPSTFVLQVPGDAKRVDLDAMTDRMEPKAITLPAARDQAAKEGWKLLEPSYVPGNATLVELRQVPALAKMTGSSVFVLNYSSATADFGIVESKGEHEKMLGNGYSGIAGGREDAFKDVTVRGVQGKAFAPAGTEWVALTWQEQGTGVSVSIHGKLSLDEALKIAEGMK
jgi:outer membrane lipoprotein-sorting protein